MNQTTKNSLHQKAVQHVQYIQSAIKQILSKTQTKISHGKQEIKQMRGADQMVQQVLNTYNQKREEELNLLHPSPYFVRCDILLNTTEKQTLFFAKFPFSEESIYSWITPASAIRFEKPGPVSYQKPDGTMQSGTLIRKDQYMIVDGHVVFLATESIDTERELVYQEHFSTRKTGFVLPEIVEQMEKAQDQVIRAHYKGPFVISGPAGSGKTTLALHRVAYLAQSPDSMEQFKSHTIIIFVQDNGTKAYFSHLLPELGITDVTITTFADWAKSILGLQDIQFINRYDTTESEKDLYEWQKMHAFRNNPVPAFPKSPFTLLETVYKPYLSAQTKELFQQQKEEKVMDRFDLTLLLESYQKTHTQLDMELPYFVEQKNGRLTRKSKKFPLEYSLMVIDEFQNYLPEQLSLLRGCANKTNAAMVYVGDMAQQIHLGTIRNWHEIQEEIGDERKVILQKVYRNTKSILQYIQSLGYTISIPVEIKTGVPVVEQICSTKTEELEYIKKLTTRADIGSIGLLAKDESYLAEFKKLFGEHKNIHVLSMAEAQGVEFDIVCIVGLNKDTFSVPDTISTEFIEQKKRIQKDLLYVALTRAISELHILGNERLSVIISERCFLK